jgi:hypothetical protein
MKGADDMNGRHIVAGLVCLAACLALAGSAQLGGAAAQAAPKAVPAWKDRLAEEIPLFGHGNWIAIVDSAYPAQTREGVETLVTNAGQVEVVRTVLQMLDKAPHVTPVVYTDAELAFVPEEFAKGIGSYRRVLSDVLEKREVSVLPHEEIIGELDKAGETFRVLVLKTDLTLPYTSVFLRLDCGYWSPEGEAALRGAMGVAQ